MHTEKGPIFRALLRVKLKWNDYFEVGDQKLRVEKYGMRETLKVLKIRLRPVEHSKVQIEVSSFVDEMQKKSADAVFCVDFLFTTCGFCGTL